MLLLISGAVGLLEPYIGAAGILGVLSLTSFGGVLLSLTLPEVE
ncbi:hypothetical protein ACKC9G_16790 [Pokkaliibacter sp. CJK22405]